MVGMESREIEAYAKAWQERWREEEKGERRRANLALAAAHQMATFLAGEYGVSRVWLFGSLALYFQGLREFRADSDIDLAVEGLVPEQYFQAGARLEQLSDFPVDLISMEACRPRVRQRILEKGILLYEREGTPAYPCHGD